MNEPTELLLAEQHHPLNIAANIREQLLTTTMEKLTLQIDGMSCGHCVSAVKQGLAAVPGVTVESVSIGQAVISYEPEQANAADITDALADVGYEASATS